VLTSTVMVSTTDVAYPWLTIMGHYFSFKSAHPTCKDTYIPVDSVLLWLLTYYSHTE